ncbi:phosphoribosylamine--glycine ligase [bacterium]|nr:phosphoribosylamine--glycine ligase [bacterium]
MKVLVIGSGGREHALCWKIAQNPKVTQIVCAPGNAGILQHADCVEIDADDIDALKSYVAAEDIDLTIVGPEAPLVAGIVDEFQKDNLRIFGPVKYAAQLEGSKAFAKQFMAKYSIPTARFNVFEKYQEALDGLKEYSFPVVIKASGLAAGKGVIICQSKKEADSALKGMMVNNRFKDAGTTAVVEEYLDGEEVSVLALTDGNYYFCLSPSQDHKRRDEGDKGPNTGGMGAYAPAPLIDPDLQVRIEEEILVPTLDGLREEGHPFVGCLYLGLMITSDGPKVLEYNVRFGDPEAQVVLPLLKTDFVDIANAILDGTFKEMKTELHDGSAACVVIASGGYPRRYEKEKPITGLKDIPEGVTVFHAGTKWHHGDIASNGGRVLGVTGVADNLKSALDLAYQGVDKIHFDKAFFRRDIGKRAL